jgi:hypothetical protein
LSGVQRALRWLTAGRQQQLPSDTLLSYWFALAALLSTQDYRNVLGGVNSQVRTGLKDFLIRDLDIPATATISRDYLLNKLLRGDPPLQQKLEILTQRLGVEFSAESVQTIASLGRLRGELVHSGSVEQPSPENLRQLENIVERIALALASNAVARRGTNNSS